MTASAVSAKAGRRRQSWFWPLVFLLPTIVGLVVFRLLPIFWSFALSFMDWQIFDTASFVGLANYLDILRVPELRRVLWITVLFALMYVPGVVILALFLAVVVNKAAFASSVFRGTFFLPFITSTVAVTLVWRWIFSTRFGLLNNMLDWIGISANPAWLADPAFALPAVALVSIWKDSGFYMLLLLAGLQTIDPTYYEAARVDGAKAWKRFRCITVPLLSRSLFFVLIIAMIRSTQTFEITYALTGGGPNGSTTSIAFAIYLNAFVHFDMGQAAALSYILCIALGLLTLLNFHFRKRWVHE